MFLVLLLYLFFFCKQKTAYELRSSDWSSDVCSSDLYFHSFLLRPSDRGGGEIITLVVMVEIGLDGAGIDIVLVLAEESRSQPPQRLARQKDDQGGEDARGRDGAILNRPQRPVGHLAALFAPALPGAAYEIAGLQPVLEGAGGGGELPPRLFRSEEHT